MKYFNNLPAIPTTRLLAANLYNSIDLLFLLPSATLPLPNVITATNSSL